MVRYDPFSSAVMDDPNAIYRQLRDEAPAYYIEKYDAWALSRFQDIWDASSDPRYSVAKGTTPAHVLTKVQPVTPMINVMDPPGHTRLRVVLRPRFGPRYLKGLEGTVRTIVRECLDKALPRGRFDVIQDLAAQVSVKVTCMAVGLPVADGELLNGLVWRFFGREPGIDGMTPDGLAAMDELFAYFAELARKRRERGSDAGDVVDMFCQYEQSGRLLSEDEIASHLTMLIIGGSETFPKTFASGVLRLAEHPDQRARCAAEPQRIPDAYQEMLRFDMPTQFLARTLRAEVAIHGEKMQPGQAVLFLYPSANRDSREFESPDVFDIERRAPRILSFGAGTHSCLGLHVAKLEGKVCFEELLASVPEYEVDLSNAERLRTEFVQGFTSLPIEFAI